jgi:uncharacterized coiled-coil protein SlyX
VLDLDYLPGWARTSLTLLLGAGGARLLAVMLENRRLTRRDYRETLEKRIKDLERQVGGLYERIANLREELGGLEEALADERTAVERMDQDNARLRARLLEVDPERDPDG